MTFGHPENAVWILVFLACMALAVAGWKARDRRVRLFVSLRMKNVLLRGVSAGARLLRESLWLLALAFVLFALLAPRWGFHWEEVTRKGIDFYIAIDASRSMLCADVPPSRLERARLEVKALLAMLHGDRAGLITFAGEAFLKCPLTYDTAAVSLFLDDISVSEMPVGGTSLASAIQAAARRFAETSRGGRVLVILSDGEDHDAETEKAIRTARDMGMTVHTIGIGTPDGAPIPIEKGENRQYVKDRSGQIVVSKLVSDSLRRISEATGGTFAVSSQGTDLQLVSIYESRLSSLEKTEFEQKKTKRYHERYAYFAAAGLVLLTLSLAAGRIRRK
jgi:Ca-activated chloride channel family protein